MGPPLSMRLAPGIRITVRTTQVYRAFHRCDGRISQGADNKTAFPYIYVGRQGYLYITLEMLIGNATIQSSLERKVFWGV